MKTIEFAKTVSWTCKQVMKARQFRYLDIEINYKLPYVSIGMNGCEFFCQGDDADTIIEGAKVTADKTGLAVSTCIIWWLESAGIWSQPK